MPKAMIVGTRCDNVETDSRMRIRALATWIVGTYNAHATRNAMKIDRFSIGMESQDIPCQVS
jgi:hypothetical protein